MRKYYLNSTIISESLPPFIKQGKMMPVNKSVMNRHRDRHHQSAFPYDGFSGIQQRVVIAASLLLCAGDGSKYRSGVALNRISP